MRSIVTAFRIEFARRMRGLTLDCGCGEGDYLQYLPPTTILLDVDFESLCQLEGTRVQASILALPFRDHAFDSLWGCAIIEHVEQNCIPEAQRVLKPNGRMALLTPNRLSPADVVRRALGTFNWYSHEGHVRLWSVSELRRYGMVYGEIRFLPVLNSLAKRLPWLGHTIMLYKEGKQSRRDVD